MKWRRSAPESAQGWEAEGVVGEDEMPSAPGWTGTVTTGAAALGQRVARGALWVAVLGGPVLGVVALVQSSGSAAVPQPVRQPERTHSPDTAGPAGFAVLATDAYLTAVDGQEQELAVFFPLAAQAQLRLPDDAEASGAERMAPVRVSGVGAGGWSVTVAVRLTGPSKDDGGGERAGGVRYFQVAVSRGASGGYTALALPSEVAAPAGGGEPVELGYGRAGAVPRGDAAGQMLRGFFDAYLAGAGQLERYVAPGVRLSAVSPAPYARVRLVQLAVAGVDGGVEALGAPRGGRRVRLLVDIEGESSVTRQWRPMTYALQLAARDGRWEIAAMEPAPQAAGQKGFS